MKKITFLALLFCFLLPLTGCGGDSNIDLVKNASFRGYETTTIGKMLDGTFDKTKWTSQQNPKGETLVLFEGRIPQKMHDTLKGQLLRLLAGQHAYADSSINNAIYTAQYIPTVLGRDRTGDGFAEPLLSECNQKYLLNTPSLPQNVKSELDKARASLAQSKATGSMFLEDDRREVARLEREWAAVQEMETPAWETGKKECADKLMQVSHAALDDLYWVAGDTVFFEWKIHSDGKRFELSRFGGQSIPSITFDGMLKIIYDQ